MKFLKNSCLIFCLLLLAKGYAQHFQFTSDTKYEEFQFKSVGNLIVLQIELNGVPLNFVLDSGVKTSVVLSLSGKDSIEFAHTEEFYLKGLGKKEPFVAVRSEGNYMQLGSLIDSNHEVFIVLDDEINFSKRLGIPIHGIIGYTLLKDFVVEIDYDKHWIRFYPHQNYSKKLKRRVAQLPLIFTRGKPYIDIGVASPTLQQMHLLLDTGSSDALWLFKNDTIAVPEKYFEDFLGKGLSGEIHGKRSKVDQVQLGKFSLAHVKCAYPDTVFFSFARRYKDRNGSVGGELLSRFQVTLNYKDAWVRLKKSKQFSQPFYYNMSGIRLQHNGVRIVAEKQRSNQQMFSNAQNKGVTKFFEEQLKYKLAPSLEIIELRKDSPAARVGLQIGDVLLIVNNKLIVEQSISEVQHMLNTKAGKKVKVVIDRKGEVHTFKFQLEKVL